MENASKALLMAGGMLIALLVIGALLLAFNQIGDYEKGKSSMTKSSQVADFNKEFGKYSGDDIKGYDILTLINKAVDFNSRKDKPTQDGANYVDYSKTMTITLKNMKAFISKHGTGDTDEWLNDKQDVYEITSENNIIPKGIDTFTGLENTYKIQRLRSLSANYESVYEKNEKSVKDIIGVDDDRLEGDKGKKIIKQYREYSEFKSSTFKSTDTQYSGDQIIGLTFEYVNQ